jgi:UDP-glucose-4-epimerase GalE
VSILIVGGAGYIGSHTAKLCALAGLKPIVLDNLVFGHRAAVKWGPLIEGDLADRDLVARVLRDHRVKAVIHFAAYTYVGESMTDPGKYFRNNVVGTINLLDAMAAQGVRDLVFSSTCATYGEPQVVPLDEEHPQHPVSAYGESKLIVERMLPWYQTAHGLRYAVLRYFNAAGADPDGELGEDHHPESHLIPLAIQSVLGRRPPLDIYGTDYPTPDGTAVRDYIHVTDLGQAHLAALRRLDAGADKLVVNLGTGRGHSVRDVIRSVEVVSGRKLATRELGRRAGDPPILVADARKAAQVLGWRPQYADLDTIVRHAFRWHERQR